MREIIRVKLPFRIGDLINKGIVKAIRIESNHKIIEITVLEDGEFIENFEDNKIIVKATRSIE